jgi:hypothetical protein
MTLSELQRRFEEMGFKAVNGPDGWQGYRAWRHRSAWKTQHYGSAWMKDGVLCVNGTRSGGYRLVFSAWVRPTRIDQSLANPFAVWEGEDLRRLVAAMEERIGPSTTWPPRS